MIDCVEPEGFEYLHLIQPNAFIGFITTGVLQSVRSAGFRWPLPADFSRRSQRQKQDPRPPNFAASSSVDRTLCVGRLTARSQPAQNSLKRGTALREMVEFNIDLPHAKRTNTGAAPRACLLPREKEIVIGRRGRSGNRRSTVPTSAYRRRQVWSIR